MPSSISKTQAEIVQRHWHETQITNAPTGRNPAYRLYYGVSRLRGLEGAERQVRQPQQVPAFGYVLRHLGLVNW